jgi:hypothetical protein
MNTNIFTAAVVAALTMTAAPAFADSSLPGCGPSNNTPNKCNENITGPQGDSAYQVAVDNGFDGTEVEWLETLKGETGQQGPKGDAGSQGETGQQGLVGNDGRDGDSAYQVAVNNGFNGTEVEWLATLSGKDADIGDFVDVFDQYTKDMQDMRNQYMNGIANAVAIGGLNIRTPNVDQFTWGAGLGGVFDGGDSANSLAAGAAYGFTDDFSGQVKLSRSLNGGATNYFVGVEGVIR